MADPIRFIIVAIVGMVLIGGLANLLTQVLNVKFKLHEAVKRNDLAKVKELVDAGAPVNELNASGCTPFYLAVSKQNVEMLRFMLLKGADVNIASKPPFEQTPLYVAVGTPGPAFRKPGWNSRDQLDVIKLLLDAGADVNAQSYDGKTALMGAGGNLTVIKLLLDAGADVNAKSTDGRPALIFITDTSQPLSQEGLNVVHVLLDKGADVNVKTRHTTALMNASRAGDLEVVKALLDKGADVNARTMEYGHTALSVAANAEVRALLVYAGAKK